MPIAAYDTTVQRHKERRGEARESTFCPERLEETRDRRVGATFVLRFAAAAVLD